MKATEPSRRAVGYARVSTERQAEEGFSIDEQPRLLKEAAQRDRSSEHRRIAAEAALPEPIRDHRDRRRAGPIFLSREKTAERRLHAERAGMLVK